MCRDPRLQAREYGCEACGQALDLGGLEASLLSHLALRVKDYQLQDLACTKCKQVAAGHMSCQCAYCNGPLRATQPPAAFRKGVVVFRNIARFHGFELLQESAQWLLDSSAATADAS